MNRSTAPLNESHLLISILHYPENIDFQRLLIVAIPEKSQGLLHAIPIQIHLLHGLDIGTGSGRGILCTAVEDLINLPAQFRVFIWYLWNFIQLVKRSCKHASAQQEGQQQAQHPDDAPFPPVHSVRPLS